MKKYIIAFILSFAFVSSAAYAYDCPFGLVNDPAPGQCQRFIDTNNSGYCDHSEILAQNTYTPTSEAQTEDPNELITGQELKTKTIAEVAQLYNIPISPFISALKKQFSISQLSDKTPFQLLHDNYGVQPNTVKQIASALAQGTAQEQPKSPLVSKSPQTNDRYNFGLISSITLILYIVSWLLSQKKVYSIITHRKIWNCLLGIHFFATAALGILLVLRITYGLIFPLPFNMLFWHVEAGIVFSIIALFHIAWHWPYIKTFFVRTKKKK